jgi:hypothetical protein
MFEKSKTKLILGLGVFWLLSFPGRSPAYEETSVTNGGTIRGAVKAPKTGLIKPPPLKISKFKEFCKNVPNETWVVGPGSGVRYAVVTLEGVTRGKPLEREAVHELDNVDCRFVPHVQTASVGQFLLVKNSDPILHAAHAVFSDGQPQFNVGLYPGKIVRKPLVSPGVAKIICEVHPWMSAYVVVTDHPYHAVTDLYGEYEIRDIPPGTYRLKAWHESLGAMEKEIEVKAGGVSSVEFTLSLPKGAKR